MAKTTWKQVVYDVADAIRTVLNNENLIAVGDLASTIQTLKDTSDATVSSFDVGKDEVAYGPEGKIIGTAPFNFVTQNNETLEYKVLENGIILSNDAISRKLININSELKFEDEFNISDIPNAEEVAW